MNISSWSESEIAKLPDHLFGARNIVSGRIEGTTGDEQYGISMEAFPDVCMLWSVFVDIVVDGGLEWARMTARLGDQLPTAAAEVLALPFLLPGWGNVGEIWNWYSRGSSFLAFSDLRKVIRPQGRRLVLFGNMDAAVEWHFCVGCCVSSIPREIPDWYL